MDKRMSTESTTVMTTPRIHTHKYTYDDKF